MPNQKGNNFEGKERFDPNMARDLGDAWLQESSDT
jgi:hypothetical protein